MAAGRNTIVTSFSPEGYEAYGKDFLASFREFWPSSIRVVCYLDHGVSYPKLPDDIENSGNYRGINNADGWVEFSQAISYFPLMLGNHPNGYNIQYDASQARKAFIEADAVAKYGGKVFWIDADVVTHAHVSDTFLDDVLPDNRLCCFLGRDGWFYTESGFIGFNADHPQCSTFMQAYLSIYKTGAIFTQQAWHDCIGFDMIRRVSDPSMFVNLAQGQPHGTMHPFVNSILGSVMDHRKGKRKKTRSTKEDLVAPRSEPYWNV